MCRIPGCSLSHDNGQHYCRTCKEKDSDHYSSKCTGSTTPPAVCVVIKSIRKTAFTTDTYGLGGNGGVVLAAVCAVSTSMVKLNCGAYGCTENHKMHFCHTCKIIPSNHLTRNCPTR